MRGEAPALLSARERLTYRALAERANRYARWALAQNLGKGETLALLMPNRPEYMAVWLGISAVGGVVALINTNLRGAALAHCVDIVAPKHLIVAAELGGEFRSAVPLLSTRPRSLRRTAATRTANLPASIARSSDIRPSRCRLPSAAARPSSTARC